MRGSGGTSPRATEQPRSIAPPAIIWAPALIRSDLGSVMVVARAVPSDQALWLATTTRQAKTLTRPPRGTRGKLATPASPRTIFPIVLHHGGSRLKTNIPKI